MYELSQNKVYEKECENQIMRFLKKSPERCKDLIFHSV